MKIEVSVALLLLLVGSSLQQDAQYEVKGRHGAIKRLTDKYNKNSETLTEYANKTQDLEAEADELRKLLDETRKELHNHIYYCPDRASPKNTESTEMKRWEGAKVDFTCKDGYYQCQQDQSITCEAGRTWAVSGTSKCEEKIIPTPNSVVNTDMSFNRDLPTGTHIIVKGKPTAHTLFAVNLYDRYNNIILHAVFRFTDQKLIVNRYIGWWGSEYYPYLWPWPVQVNRDFTFVVELGDRNFEVYLDNKWMFSYSTQGRKVLKVQVRADAVCHLVEAGLC